MFLFLRLLLAHMLGDFPFQFDVIYKMKATGLRGLIPHASIIFVCGIALSWPYLYLPQVWFFVFFVSISHLWQDSIKLSYNAIKHSLLAYLLDQVFHVATIALLFLTELKKLSPPQNQENIVVWLYSNDRLIIYLIALIAATYNGHFMIRCFKDTFWGRQIKCYSYEKWYGMFERALIVTLFFARLPLLLILPISLLLRPLTFLFFKKNLNLHPCFTALPEIILSWSVAMITGIFLSLL
jgi:hypothetical protein